MRLVFWVVHHWLIFTNNEHGDRVEMPYCKTKLGEMWGIGAELRGVHYDYGKEFAVVLTGEEHMELVA